MDRIQIDTAQNVELDLPIAGLGDRLIAALLDYGILGAYTIVMSTFGVAVIATSGSNTPIAVSIIVLLPVFSYFLLCEIFLDGQSIGKRYMNIKVTRLNGTPASIGNFVVRWLLRPIDVTLTSGLAAVLSILITGTGQRLGDLAAGTTVVKLKDQSSVKDLPLTEVEPTGTPQFPEVDRLSDEDVHTANDVLAVLKYKRRSHRREELGQRTKRALQQKMGITTDLSPRDFLAAIVEDYTQHYGDVSDDAGSPVRTEP